MLVWRCSFIKALTEVKMLHLSCPVLCQLSKVKIIGEFNPTQIWGKWIRRCCKEVGGTASQFRFIPEKGIQDEAMYLTADTLGRLALLCQFNFIFHVSLLFLWMTFQLYIQYIILKYCISPFNIQRSLFIIRVGSDSPIETVILIDIVFRNKIAFY